MDRMDESPANEFFTTSDLFLASFLLTKGHRLHSTDGSDPRRVVFVLTPRPDSKDLVAYAEGNATATVFEFVRAMRYLKKQIWAIRDGREVAR
jgi:hypothetical protein